MQKTVVPYVDSDTSKKEQVAQMFNNIASNYDFLNRFLSGGIDIYWRNKMIAQLKSSQPQKILDVATGTGDVAIALTKLKPEKIMGIDISSGMLELGKKKIAAKKLDHLITMQQSDAENIPFEDNTYDAITVAFGVRNYENLEKGLKEMHRVLNTGGKLIVLEFSKPKRFPIKQFYNFYFAYILPVIGKFFSKDPKAYTYLPESVAAFPEGKDFENILTECGYIPLKTQPLTFGICSLYVAEKK